MEFTLLLFHSVVICVDKVKTCCSDLVVINAAVLYSFQQMRCRQAVFYHYCINPSHTFYIFMSWKFYDLCIIIIITIARRCLNQEKKFSQLRKILFKTNQHCQLYHRFLFSTAHSLQDNLCNTF